MPVTYARSPEMEQVAARLIQGPHSHLSEEHVEYVFRSEPAKRAGRTLYGDARKVSGLTAFLSQADVDFGAMSHEDALRCSPFFVIVVAREVWNVFPDEAKEALLDHLLSRCRVEHSENGARLVVVQPDGEFHGVLARHGAWRQGLVELFQAAEDFQPGLFSPGLLDTIAVGAVDLDRKDEPEPDADDDDLTDPDDEEETFEEEYARTHPIDDEKVADIKRAARKGEKAAAAQ
jgi:hypothetical protein